MPFQYSFDSAHALLYIAFSGHVDVATLLAVRQTIRADPRFDPSLPTLVNVTQVSALALVVKDVLQFEPPPDAPAAARIAIVATSPAQRDLARVFCAIRGPQAESLVTPYMDEALEWLGRRGWTPPP